MEKDELKFDLDLDLSKYNYNSAKSHSFSIDDILGQTSEEKISEPKDIEQSDKNEIISKGIAVEENAKTPNVENKEHQMKSVVEAENKPIQQSIRFEQKIENLSSKKSTETPIVNTAAFDQIKAKSKAKTSDSDAKINKINADVTNEQTSHTMPSRKPEVIEEFSVEAEREDVIFDLKSLKNKITAKVIVMLLLFLGSVYLTLARIEHLRFLLPTQLDPAQSPKNYLLTVFALTLLAFFLNISPLFDGLKKMFTARLTADGIALFLGISCIAYDVYFWFNPEIFVYHVITLDVVFVLMLLMNLMGKRLLVKHIACNFKMFSDERLKSVVAAPCARAIDNDVMIETGNGGDVLYVTKAKRVSDYMKKAFAEQNVNRKTDIFYFLLYIFILICCAVLWLCKVIEVDEFLLLLTAFYALCSPVLSSWTRTLSTFRLGRFLRSNSTMVSGREGAYKVADCGVLVVRDTDILSNNDISLNDMTINEGYDEMTVVSTLASLFKKVDGPLQGIFEKILTENLHGNYPEVCDVFYHEQFGYTFVSSGSRFAVGTNEFMQQLKIECMPKHTAQGTNVYIAIDGKVAGVFTLQYQLSKRSARALQLLENENISVAVLTTDFCLRESLFADVLYDPDFITILSNETANECVPLCSKVENATAEITTYNSIFGIALGLNACNTLISNHEKHGTYRITASVFGAIIITLSGLFLPSLGFWLPLQVLLYQFIWSLPVFLMGLKTKK